MTNGSPSSHTASQSRDSSSLQLGGNDLGNVSPIWDNQVQQTARQGAYEAAPESERRLVDDAARRSKEDAEWERRFGVKAAVDHSSPRPARGGPDDGSFRPSRHQIPFPTAQSLKVAARGDDGIRNYFFRVKLAERDTFTFVGTEPLLHSLMEKFGRKGKDPLEVPGEERVVVLCTEEGRVMVGYKKALLDLLRIASLRSWIRRDVIMCRSASFAWTEIAVVPFVLGVERGDTPSALASARIESALL